MDGTVRVREDWMPSGKVGVTCQINGVLRAMKGDFVWMEYVGCSAMTKLMKLGKATMIMDFYSLF